jgi:hypothetical protein
MKLVLITILILTTSCKSQKALTLANADDRLTLLVQDGYFFTDSLETNVIRDHKSLKSFFSRVNKTRKPGILVPEVDFTKEMVLIACMGEQKVSGLPILSFLEENGEEISIGIEINDLSKNDNSSMSYPFCVYKMPISEKKVNFLSK